MTDNSGKRPMSLRPGERGEGLNQGADWNGLLGIDPSLGKDIAGTRVQQEVEDGARGKLAVECGSRCLRKKRWRRFHRWAAGEGIQQEHGHRDGTRSTSEAWP